MFATRLVTTNSFRKHVFKGKQIKSLNTSITKKKKKNFVKFLYIGKSL